MSEKTLGHLLLEDAIPEGYRPQGPYTKGALYKQMTRLAKDDPAKYVTTITKVKALGDEFATLEGISVGLDDIAPIYADRDAVVRPAMAAIQRASTREQRQQIVSQTQKKLLDYTKTHPGTMGDMARSGGRGNMVQLMKAVGSPVAANDEKDRVQPWLITKSYSEGLRPSEWWVANREARMAAVKSNIEVTEPGDLSKIIVNNTQGQVVTMPDCDTKNGLRFSVDSPENIDRYLAQSAGSYPAETRLTQRVLDDLRKKGVTHIIVRSPMTCEAGSGVCQLCMGRTVTGRLNNIGDNVGVRASHALGEPLTQLALNAKHGVRTAGGAAGVSGLEGFRAIIETPASFKNKATLAPVDGRVERIDPAPQGGHYVIIAGQKAYVAAGLNVTVRAGDMVRAGDVISEGTPRPDEVVRYKGLGAGREYVVEKLQGIYKDSGVDVDRRHLEILAKSTLNHLRVEDVPANTLGVVRGDIIDYNQFRRAVQGSVQVVPLDSALGKHLGAAALHHLPGTRVTPALAEELRRAGIREVSVAMVAPKVTPIMAPATGNPLLNPDWLVRAGFRKLKQGLLEGAQQGHTTDIRGTNPVPAMVFNPEFGEGPGGRY